MGLLGFLARISKVSRLRSAFPETLDGSRVPLLCFNRAQTAKRELEAEEEVEIKWEKEPQKKKKWLEKNKTTPTLGCLLTNKVIQLSERYI